MCHACCVQKTLCNSSSPPQTAALTGFSPSSAMVRGPIESPWRQCLAASDLLLTAELVSEGSSLKICWEGVEKDGGGMAGIEVSWGLGVSRTLLRGRECRLPMLLVAICYKFSASEQHICIISLLQIRSPSIKSWAGLHSLRRLKDRGAFPTVKRLLKCVGVWPFQQSVPLTYASV